MTGMTNRIRMITYVTAAVVVIATTVGCGILSSAKNLAANVGTLGDLSNKITSAEKLTYEATYKASDGSTNTVAQAPPKVAYLSADSDWIYTGDTIYNCDKESGALTCTKTAETDTADPSVALASGGFASGEFFSGALGITLLTAATLVPGAKINKTTKKIAGLSSTCVDVTNLPGTKDGDEDLVGFSMCVADNGIVTNFVGTDSSGKNSGVTLESFKSKPDASAFLPPAGATISTAVTPTISTPASAPASSPASSAPSTAPSPSPSNS
jgi:hypothetical protein